VWITVIATDSRFYANPFLWIVLIVLTLVAITSLYSLCLSYSVPSFHKILASVIIFDIMYIITYGASWSISMHYKPWHSDMLGADFLLLIVGVIFFTIIFLGIISIHRLVLSKKK